MGLEWCIGMPPLVHFLDFISLLVYVSPLRHRPREDVVGLEWCMGMPPLVHFLNTISVLVYVSPPRASLPCHVSFTAGGEFGWARVVLAVHASLA